MVSSKIHYTAQEEKKIITVLSAFSGYIAGNKRFDILRSPKAGYLKIMLDEDSEEFFPVQFETAEELLIELFSEVKCDVYLEGTDDWVVGIPAKARPEIRRRCVAILEQIQNNGEHYFKLLDDYLEENSCFECSQM